MRNLNNSNLIKASIIGLTGIVLMSAKSIFAKIAYEYNADPISVLFLRMLISLPFLMVIGLLYEKKQKSFESVKWKDIASIIALSFFGYYISALFDFVGLLYVDAAIERLIVFTYPTIIIIISAVFLRKEVKPRQISAIVVSYFGIIISFGNKLMITNSHQFWFGVTLVFLSSLTYAIFLIASENVISRVGSMRFTTIATITMCVCVIIHAAFAGKTNIISLDKNVIWACTLMALLSTIAPIYMFNFALGRIGVTNISIIASLGPACTLILSAILLNETITLWEIVGTFVVMGGVLLISFEKVKKENIGTYLRKSYAFIAVWGRFKTPRNSN